MAQKGTSIGRQAASQLADSAYVDDRASGGTKDEVMRIAGSYHNEGSIAQIPKLGEFTAKAYVVGGDCSEKEAETLGGKFLGISYEPLTDIILAHMVLTILPKEKRE